MRLSYHVNDPTGTSLVLVDGNGDEAGRMVYDGFGMVMENTLTAELTGALLDMPDAATGLVHLGGGRWYDPALGRPLQPNSAGGPPTVPQALNRYAATPMGQPGVYAAAVSSQGTLSSFSQSLISNSIGEGVSDKIIAPLGMRLIRTYWQEIVRNPSASGGALRRGTQRLVDAGLLTSEARTQLIRNGYWRGGSNSAVDELRQLTRTIGGSEELTIARRIGGFSVGGISIGDLSPGFGADLIVGSLWQAVLVDGDLWQTDPWLATRRALHAGTVNATVGVGGAFATAGILALVNIPDPSDIVVVPLTIVITSILDVSIGDFVSRIYQPLFGDLDIPRNLEPLIQ